MLIHVLGPIEVRASPDGSWTRPAPQQRLVIALLVAQLSSTCRIDRLVQALWGDEPPGNARRLLQAIVSRLRPLLDSPDARGSRLRSVPGGWILALQASEVDAVSFEELAQSGHAFADEGDLEAARRRLEAAAGLWRGRAFGDMADHPALVADSARLREERVGVEERLLAVRLRAGEHIEVAPELEGLVTRHPLRERAWALLLEALCRSGRQADALAAYQRLRDRLVAELGTEPGPQLQRLHVRILRGELPEAGLASASATPAGGRLRADPSLPCRRDLPLIGRDRELAALHDAFTRACDSRTQLVLVHGEPGIGKTRLVAEFADAAAPAGAVILVGRCGAGGEVAYQPVVEALRADVAATPKERLAGRLGRGGGELARLLPELADVDDLPVPTRSLSPELDQHRLFGAVGGWLGSAAAEQPLVLVIEDVHAATRPTLLLLRHVVGAVTAGRLLLLATYRDTGDEMPAALGDTVGELVKRPEVIELQLVGLDRAAVSALVAARHADLGGRERWAETVHGATAGNPLFVEELLADVNVESLGSPDGLLDPVRVPRGVRQLLQARVRRLSPATTRFLQQAAVAGDRFDFADITTAAGLDDDDALDALAEATAARLVTTTEPGGDRYRFAHAVMRTALLAEITPSRRMRLHARLATTLETRRGHDRAAAASVIAYHYAAAGAAADPTKTLGHTVAAADDAMEQFAYDEAAAHYRRALAILRPGDDEPQRCELLTCLGQAQARTGHAEHRSTLVRATRLAIELGDAERTAAAALAGSRGFFSHLGGVDNEQVVLLHDALEAVSSVHPGPRAVLLALLGSELVFTADLSRRRAVTDEAVWLARQQSDLSVLCRVLALRQMTIQHPDTLGERLDETAELTTLAQRLADPLVETLAHMWRFLAVLEIGDRPAADAAVDHARRLADAELGHPVVEVFLTTMDAARELLWGDLDRAQQLAERYRQLGRRAGVHDIDSPYLAHQFILHRERDTLPQYVPLLERAVDAYGMVPAWQAAAALVWWLTGRHERALGVLDRYAADDFASVPHDHLWTDTLCLFAEVAALAGRREAARALVAHLGPYHDRLTAEPAVPLGTVAHYLALAATSLEDWDSAQMYFDEAAEMHAKIDADRWYTRTLRAYARMHLTRGDPGDRRAAQRLLRHAAERARGRRSGVHALDRSEHAAPTPVPSDDTVAPP